MQSGQTAEMVVLKNRLNTVTSVALDEVIKNTGL